MVKEKEKKGEQKSKQGFVDDKSQKYQKYWQLFIMNLSQHRYNNMKKKSINVFEGLHNNVYTCNIFLARDRYLESIEN